MIQGLADLLAHDGQDDTCLDAHIVDILNYVGPPARSALPVLKNRLEEARTAAAVGPRGEKWGHMFLDESSLCYRLELAIASIERTDISRRKSESP